MIEVQILKVLKAMKSKQGHLQLQFHPSKMEEMIQGRLFIVHYVQRLFTTNLD